MYVGVYVYDTNYVCMVSVWRYGPHRAHMASLRASSLALAQFSKLAHVYVCSVCVHMMMVPTRHVTLQERM